MVFEQGHLYHLFNQGNNREEIFFSRDNYLFFLSKINQFILPHADILAWCLMPNHFHLMIYVHTLTVQVSDSVDELKSSAELKFRTLPQSIAILLRSYTRAINIQEKRSGSLFRAHTKAECVTKDDGNTSAFFNTSIGTQIHVRVPEKEYPQVCFNYIHMNPVKAKLVEKAEDWEFSSFQDYSEKRAGKLVNKERAGEFLLFS